MLRINIESGTTFILLDQKLKHKNEQTPNIIIFNNHNVFERRDCRF